MTVPPYLGACGLSWRQNDALASHSDGFKLERYQSQYVCGTVRPRNTHVSLTSEPGRARHFAVRRPLNINRRPRCQRASNSLQRSASLPQSRHVPAASQMKNMLWLSPRPFRSSQHTQVSTSKPVAGQAVGPVLPSAAPVAVSAFLNGGA